MDRPDVGASVEHVGREAVPQDVRVPSACADESSQVTPDDPLHLPMAEFSGVHGACFGHRELDRNRASRIDETRAFQATMAGAFANGRVLAVAGGSDSHYSFPGDHGLVAVLADSLSRDDILAAIRARRTYATTGASIVLEMSVDGRPMGSVLDSTTPPHVRVRVEGTTDLRDVRLLLSGDEIARGTIDGARGELDLVLDAVPADGSWLQIEVVQDDQQAALSTPVWFRPGTPVLDDDELLADKERMTVLVLAAVLRGWPYLPQPELGGRGPAYCKDDPEAWAVVLEEWPQYLQRIDDLNALGERLGMTDADAMQALIDRWGRTWQLPRAASLAPTVSPLVDAAPMRAAMGL